MPDDRSALSADRSPKAHADSVGARTAQSEQRLLSVEHLTTGFDVGGRFLPAVIDVSFQVGAGETLGLVGESGSGKSVTALSILRLVQPPGRIAGGRLLFKGQDLRTLDEHAMRKVRGAEIALIFQEPMTALNPVFTSAARSRRRCSCTIGRRGARRAPGQLSSSSW